MSNAIVTKSAAVRLPQCAADTTGKTSVFRIATSTTSQSFAIPAAFSGNFCRILSVTSNAQIGFNRGSAGQTLVLNQLSSFAAPSAAAGASIMAGASLDGLVPKSSGNVGQVYFNVIADAAGYVELYLSEALNAGVGFTG
jgi:hypothetical protein